MSDLESLINIGPKLAAGLRQVGIGDAEELQRIGAAEASSRLAAAGRFDSTHSRRALTGAPDGVRWTTRS